VVAQSSYIFAGYARPLADSELEFARRLLIADAYARFCRNRGDIVLFSFGIESFGEEVEAEAASRGVAPQELVDEYRSRLHERLERLQVSCDWARTVETSQPEHRHLAQLTFLELLARNLIYRRDRQGSGGGRWFLRRSAYAAQCEQGLETLSIWTAEAIATQRPAVGGVDGIELDATLLGVGNLVVFSPHADSIADAAFVAISPNHPSAEVALSPGELARLRGSEDQAAIVQSGVQAAVPGVDGLLPVAVTPMVDTRFGPTAVLGIPDRDDLDRELAGRLEAPASLPMRATSANMKPRAATRYRLPDLAISSMGDWGTPVPVVDCEECGAVPLSAGLLVGAAETAPNPNGPGEQAIASNCPRCGRPADRDPESIAWSFDAMWIWLWPCLTAVDGEPLVFPQPRGERWLPARQAIWNGEEGEQLLNQRIAGRLVQELELAQLSDDGEPFTGAILNAPLVVDEDGDTGGIEQLDELVSRAGADVVRFAILHSASPAKATRLSAASILHAERFLEELRALVERQLASREDPVPAAIDPSTRMRRRLAAWCRIGADKLDSHLKRLEMHRASFDAAIFLKRIRAFEDSCEEEGDPTPADRDAAAFAVLRLIHAAEPLLPETAAKLEAE
jgi:leucyl-tRNA synthetase